MQPEWTICSIGTFWIFYNDIAFPQELTLSGRIPMRARITATLRSDFTSDILLQNLRLGLWGIMPLPDSIFTNGGRWSLSLYRVYCLQRQVHEHVGSDPASKRREAGSQLSVVPYLYECWCVLSSLRASSSPQRSHWPSPWSDLTWESCSRQ